MILFVHFVWRERWPEVISMDSWGVVNNLVRSLEGARGEDVRPGVWGKRHVSEPMGVCTKHTDLCVGDQYPAGGLLSNQVDRRTHRVDVCQPLPLVAPGLTQWAHGRRSYSSKDGGCTWAPSDQRWSSYCHC